MSGKITRQELAPALRQELDEVQLYIDGSNNVAYESHMVNTSNPHGVTKSQVGLGNVLNSVQATKTEFDAHTSDTTNPHGVTTAQIGAVPTSRLVSAGTGLLGGGSLGANRTLSLDLTFTDGRYLGKSAKAVDSDKLDGLNSTAFHKVGERILLMNDGYRIFHGDSTKPDDLFFRSPGNVDARVYHSNNLRFGSYTPTGGKHGDIYIQY